MKSSYFLSIHNVANYKRTKCYNATFFSLRHIFQINIKGGQVRSWPTWMRMRLRGIMSRSLRIEYPDAWYHELRADLPPELCWLLSYDQGPVARALSTRQHDRSPGVNTYLSAREYRVYLSGLRWIEDFTVCCRLVPPDPPNSVSVSYPVPLRFCFKPYHSNFLLT